MNQNHNAAVATANTSTPARANRPGIRALALGAVLGTMLGAGGTEVFNMVRAHAQHENAVHHPSLLPGSEVDRVVVRSGDTGKSIAANFTDDGPRQQELGEVIGHEGIGPDGSLMPGQVALVPKELEQHSPVNPADITILPQ